MTEMQTIEGNVNRRWLKRCLLIRGDHIYKKNRANVGAKDWSQFYQKKDDKEREREIEREREREILTNKSRKRVLGNRNEKTEVCKILQVKKAKK